MKLHARRGKVLLTEITGLTPGMMKQNGNIQQIELMDEDKKGGDSLLATGFTSPYVKSVVKDQVFARSKKFASIADAMCRLVDRGVITPVMFSDNDDYMQIVENLNVYQYEKRIMGFYDMKANSIFLCLNNLSIGAQGSISNINVISLIAHELMHYACANSFAEYKKIFQPYILYFYTNFFRDFCYTSSLTEELINRYVASILFMERNGKSQYMFDALDGICNYVSDNADDIDSAFISVKAIEKLFEYLSQDTDNGTGVKIGKLSKTFFMQPFQRTYNKTFFKMNPDLEDSYRNKPEDSRVTFLCTFYQEFIASSEISAMLAGQLVRELYVQQRPLEETHPIAKLINAII